MKIRKLAEPIMIGQAEIRNRIAMAPMNNLNQIDPLTGTWTDRCVSYYAARAKGGVGLIITGVFKIENTVERYMKDDVVLWPLITADSLPKYTELVDIAHAFGTKIFAQLSPGVGCVARGDAIDSGFVPRSASNIPAFFKPDVKCNPLTKEEIKQLLKAYASAAKIVATSGMDGIEVHGHEGYLIDQFTTSLWNKRTDEYGGNLENRVRFPLEILDVIKNAVGSSFPVIYRYGVKHFIKGPWKGGLRRDGFAEMGRDLAEGIEMAKILEKAGYDGLHVNAGCYESSYWVHPPIYQPHGMTVDLSAQVKKHVKIPVIAVSRMGVPNLAEKVIADGKADMVALGRDLLADPDWAAKVLMGRGEEVRPCIGCQEGCLRRPNMSGRPMSCSVNPTSGREGEFSFEPVKTPKKVMVIGGGVAGMEVARMAAIKGHKVTMYEKTDKLGGHLNEGSVPEFKDDIKRLLSWYERQLKKMRIKIYFKTTASRKLVLDEKPDFVMIATGSSPCYPDLPGIKNANVITSIDLLLGKKKAGNVVLIVGGGLDGCETAVWLAKKGKQVTLIEMLPELAVNVHRANRAMLLDMLAESQVNVRTNTRLEEVKSNGIMAMYKDSERIELPADTVVLATGLVPNRELYKSLIGEKLRFYELGDCREPRKIHDAILEGFMMAQAIGQ